MTKLILIADYSENSPTPGAQELVVFDNLTGEVVDFFPSPTGAGDIRQTILRLRKLGRMTILADSLGGPGLECTISSVTATRPAGAGVDASWIWIHAVNPDGERVKLAL